MDFTFITEEEFNKLENDNIDNIPRQCFVAKCSDGEYLAMDNLEGERFVDKFGSMILVKEFFANNLGYDDDYDNFEAIHRREYLY